MGDLRAFARRMTVVGETVAENADKLVRAVALAVDAEVVLATPVDTGRARANWRAGLGSGPAAELPEPSSPAAGAQEALQQAQQVAAEYQGGEGSSIVITNNLPYIRPLNDGHSSQAPAGFVETAVAEGLQAVRRAKVVTGEIDVVPSEFGAHVGEGTAPGKKET